MATINDFKTAITRIRDILRGPGVGITGMDAMRHICLYIMCRYMTMDYVAALGIPKELCWENFMYLIHEVNGGVDKAHNLFYHSELDSCLINHFDRLFGTQKLSFDVKNAKKHKEILDILNSVDIKALDRNIDVLGFVYELHLKTGAAASRDLGQFFTDRVICKYMTALCEPIFKEPGIPESVCDPTMGTGGFLTSFVKYYETTYPDTPINWTVQEKQINGCDTDPKVAGIARLNLFMETGGCKMSNILTWDSLYGDLPQNGYDVILANMPFGLKGIKHEECCKKIRDLKIGGNKSEPLFLQLMCASLNPGGRCVVVVPDGMLNNTSKCHNETRKYLLNNFEVIRIVKMSGDFFMNTNVQTSIIFFKNSGTPTTHVEFWEVSKTKTGEIAEELIVDVPRDYFDANYSLNMKMYIAEEENPTINPEEFLKVKMEDICDYQNSKTAFTRVETGEYNIMDGGMTYIGKTDKFNCEGETISISKSSASAGFVAYHSQKYWASDCLTITPKTDAIQIKYLYYYLKLTTNLITSSVGTISYCKWTDIKNIVIPLPPLEIQHEIIATLDRIYATTKLADTLKLTNTAMDLILANPGGTTLEPIVEAQRLIHKSTHMMPDIKVQMISIMNSIEKRGFPKVIISEKCSLMIGGTPLRSKPEYYDGGHHVWVSVSELCDNIIMDSKEHINDNGVNHSNVKLVKAGSVLMSFKLSIGKCGIAGIDLYTNEAIVAFNSLDNTCLLNKYLYYYLTTHDFSTAGEGSIGSGSMNKESLSKLTIPLPPITLQETLIKHFDLLQMQNLINSLEQLQHQSENNAKFILSSYLPYSIS